MGTIAAIIDTGIDYTNKEFIREDDTSRILAIWDQSHNSGTPPAAMGYGSEYSNKQILVRGTKKRFTDIYPNPYTGYGLLDLPGTFNSICGICNTPIDSSLLRPNNNDNVDL